MSKFSRVRRILFLIILPLLLTISMCAVNLASINSSDTYKLPITISTNKLDSNVTVYRGFGINLEVYENIDNGIKFKSKYYINTTELLAYYAIVLASTTSIYLIVRAISKKRNSERIETDGEPFNSNM